MGKLPLQHPRIGHPQPSPQVSWGRGSQFPLSLASEAPACTPGLKMKSDRSSRAAVTRDMRTLMGAPGRWGGGRGGIAHMKPPHRLGHGASRR